MITVLKSGTTADQREQLIRWLEEHGVKVHVSIGENHTILGLVGDTSQIDVEMIKLLDIVQDVKRVSEPYKKANKKFHPEDTIIEIGDAKIGGGNFAVIAGPCSVESKSQIIEVAQRVKEAGAQLLRGGAFKPRTSPYSFQGLKADGIELLIEAKEATGLPIVSEIMNENHLPLFDEVDVIQVGARNMQNFELLKALGETDKPILLKRGLANTFEELLMSAEYIMAGGNENIILCERGIRTFETYTRNTLDLSAVPALHELTHLPVIIDPSHAAGRADYVKPLSAAATACGADGVMIEVHNNPSKALCDGAQSLTPGQFEDVMATIQRIRAAV